MEEDVNQVGENQESLRTDFLVVGTGLAGMSFALRMADFGHVTLLSKKRADESNTKLAQGGISAVGLTSDSFDQHVEDTLIAGAGLCRKQVVEAIVHQAPNCIDDLRKWGVVFDSELTTEGGHTQRRVYHVQDHTGLAVQEALHRRVLEHPNIEVLENTFAIDLITSRKVHPHSVEPLRCFGIYALNLASGRVLTIQAKVTALATGGAGKAYLYTSNWSGATGDGIAMACRAGARVTNLEFMQFHPTCLFHPSARNFLISEALRGEGAKLVDQKGVTFMKRYHPKGSLAPRDIVARSIDNEMKLTGAECVFLDITHKSKDFLQTHFPVIYERCAGLGISMDKEPIPVVPAAHYLCGGVLTDLHGRTEIEGLFVFGESGCTGLHGANRLASNSLLECLAIPQNGAQWIRTHADQYLLHDVEIPGWIYYGNQDKDEMIVIRHMWDEIRQLMWNYVGIVRSNRRLFRAQKRLENINSEISEYYWNFALHPDILELRNIATVAELTVRCALLRKESRGIHFNIDFPETDEGTLPMDTVL